MNANDGLGSWVAYTARKNAIRSRPKARATTTQPRQQQQQQRDEAEMRMAMIHSKHSHRSLFLEGDSVGAGDCAGYVAVHVKLQHETGIIRDILIPLDDNNGSAGFWFGLMLHKNNEEAETMLRQAETTAESEDDKEHEKSKVVLDYVTSWSRHMNLVHGHGLPKCEIHAIAAPIVAVSLKLVSKRIDTADGGGGGDSSNDEDPEARNIYHKGTFVDMNKEGVVAPNIICPFFVLFSASNWPKSNNEKMRNMFKAMSIEEMDDDDDDDDETTHTHARSSTGSD